MLTDRLDQIGMTATRRHATEMVLTNALLILPEVAVRGTVVVRDGLIAEVQHGRSISVSAQDLGGDVLIPGVVDLHTDNLERQVQPRANARWPSRSAMLAHDAQCAAAGVTTVLDALCAGEVGLDAGRLRTFQEGVADLDALADTGLLKSEHFLHLRCEMPAPNVLDMTERVADHQRVRMVSLMDHSPGVGQYSDLERFRAMRRREGMSEAEIERQIAHFADQRATFRTPNRRALLARLAHRRVALASHDDATEAEVAENADDGIHISEFPVTLAAAQAAKRRGMEVIAGAPNIVRGGSHSGNVSAADLMHVGAVDALASDYVPASLVEAAFRSVETTGIALPAAIAMITDRPARLAQLPDRGRIEPGLRADLVRVRVFEGLPVVRQVWRAGERVA
jgi:alpha-D-ribose 1-methylphosphonate 5-triphosphate diphosphatase